MKLILLVFSFLYAGNLLAGDHHFFDVVRETSSWRVYHFRAQPGKLQDLVGVRTFASEAEALRHREKLARFYPQNKAFRFVTTESTAPLWTVTNQWNEAWEKKYAEWIETEFDADFFVRGDLATDCADVAYALRWIFSRNNHLPAGATLAGSGATASHLSAKAEWDLLPGHKDWWKDERFKASLRWLLNNVYTKTLYKDGYPVRLDRESVTPGLINLLGGHTEIFARVKYGEGDIPLQLLSSTVPQQVRVLASRAFMDEAVTDKENGGLIKFRWPVVKEGKVVITPKEDMYNFSMDQYRLDLCPGEARFAFCLFRILGMQFRPEVVARKMITDLEESIRARVGIVAEGHRFCQTNDCSPGTMGYEDWSTPSRDKRLAKLVSTTRNTLSSINMDSHYSSWVEEFLVPLETPMSASAFIIRLEAGLTSYDPRSTVDQRWATHEKAIEKTIHERSLETVSARSDLIAAAATCRERPEECRKDPENFRRLSTAELDKKLSDLYAGWVDHAQNYNLKVSEDVLTGFIALWSRSPAPWDPIEVREGRRSPAPHLIRGSTIRPTTGRYVIVNGASLYDTESRSYYERNSSIQNVWFDETTESFLIQTNEQFEVTDKDLVKRYALPLMYTNTAQELAPGKFFLGHYSVEGYYAGRTLDVRTGKLGEAIPYIAVYLSGHGVFLRGAEKSWSLIVDKGDFSLVQMPHFSQISNALHVKGGHDYFVTHYLDDNGTEEFGRLTPGGLRVISGSRWGSLSPLNGYFGTFTNGLDDSDYLIDFSRNSLEVLPLSVLASFENDLVVANDYRDGNLYLLNKDVLTRLDLPESDLIVSAGRDWLSDMSGRVFDFEGKLLREPNGFIISNCATQDALASCRGDVENVFQETWMPPAGVNYTYARIGSGDHFSVKSTFAYMPVDTESYESRSRGLYKQTAAEVPKGGVSVRVSENYRLWYPAQKK